MIDPDAPVAAYWPEFGAHGKSEITVSDVLRHRAGLSHLNLVQSGAELAYLLLHDPEFRRVRQADLVEVGKRIRLKRNIALLSAFLERGIEGHRFDFYVVSAAPEDVVHSALAGLVPPERIIGTRFVYDGATGEISSILRVPAGFGKVIVPAAPCVRQLPSLSTVASSACPSPS